MKRSMSTALTAHLSDRIPKAAGEANRRFPLIAKDDFEQEMWLRALVSTDMYERDLADGNEQLIWRHLKDACHRYGMQDDRDRRARKAVAEGFNTYDEVFYSAKMVGHLLSELIQAEWDLPYAMDRATKGLDQTGVRIQSGHDNGDSFMDYLALLVDVKAAYDELTPYQQNILRTWYAEGDDSDDHKWDREAIASTMGLTYNALELRKRRAVKALIYELGGESPYPQKRRGERDPELRRIAP